MKTKVSETTYCNGKSDTHVSVKPDAKAFLKSFTDADYLQVVSDDMDGGTRVVWLRTTRGVQKRIEVRIGI